MTEQVQAPTVVDGITGVADVAPRTAGVTQISGPTHQTSTGAAPDPTGLRGTLLKNQAAVQEKLANAATAAATEQNSTKTKPEPVVAKVADGTQRGPDGKFLPKGTALSTEPPADEPPSTWRTETKALWKEIDIKFGPEQGKLLKDELRKRENDFRTGIKAKDDEVASFKSFHEQINPVIAPHIQRWQQLGVTPQQAVTHLMNLEQNFQRDPPGTIKWLANAAKIDLATLVGAAPSGNPTVDPQLAPLMQTINGLQSELHQLKSGWASQTTAAHTAEIQSVIDEKGQDGQPLRPYFNDASKDIAAEFEILRNQNPQWSPRQIAIQAYENAIWKNPETRQKMIDGNEAQRRAAETAQQRQTAAELAAKNVRGGPPNQLNGAANTELRGMLTQRVNAHYGAG